jgi:hypothetical protein
MRKQHRTKLVHKGSYLPEINVELLVIDDEWSLTSR